MNFHTAYSNGEGWTARRSCQDDVHVYAAWLGLYNGDLSAAGVRQSMDHFKNKENGDPLLYLYGHGDGGGGVTKEMLESVTRLNRFP